MDPKPLPGRKAEAARNDGTILEAARAVFLRDPGAPMSAVAHEAGVGIGALYRRYPSKDALLQKLCGDGLRRFTELAEAALADQHDPWESFAGFIRGVIAADVHALTVRLAGTFTPTDELHLLAAHSSDVVRMVFERARSAGVIRSDVDVNDLPMIFEQLTAIRLPDPGRTADLRDRYLRLQLDALRATRAAALPHSPPTAAELGRRWARR